MVAVPLGTVFMSEQLTEQEKRILEFFQRLVRRVRSDWWKIVLVALALGLVGAAYAFTLPTQYLAQVTVFLVQSSSAEAQAQELLGRGPKPNQGYAAAILRSRTVAGYVASALKLGPGWSPGSIERFFEDTWDPRGYAGHLLRV